MTEDKDLYNLALQFGQTCQARALRCTTAESCTGGGVAQAITMVPGSSAWFERGFVTYSNQAKQEMLGVLALTLNKYGAVSEATALAMAEGAVFHSRAQTSVAITGIAGPDGGTAEKPVGLVWFAWARHNHKTHTESRVFTGDRQAIRAQAVIFALETWLQYLH